MEVLNPAALWLLALAAALLLLSRNQTARPRRVVANLYLWSRPAPSTPAQLTWRRVRRHWMVILQAAILATIAVALSRPMLSWSTRPVALIIDVSSSMAARDGAGTRLDLARQAARAAADALPPGAGVRLLAAGRVPTDLGHFPARDPGLHQALDGIVATAGSADIPRAIRAARALGVGAPAITVFSDGRETRVPDAGARWVTVGRSAGNQAITAMAARRLPANPDDGQIITTIRNYDTAPIDTAVEITHGDQVVLRRAVHLEARGSITVVTDVAGIGGAIRARLTTSDALAIDDRRATIVPDRRVARVLLITPGSFFLERALAANPGVLLEIAAPNSAGPRALAADVVVCDRCAALPAGVRAALMIPVLSTSAPAPVTVSRPDHPIAWLLDVGGVSAAGGALAPPPPGSDIVLRAGPDPALVAYERDGRRLVELRVDVEAAGFPLSTTFPVLLDNALAWLDARDENAIDRLAGQPLHWRLPGQSPADGASIVGPDGRAVKTTANGPLLTTTDTDAVGLYEIRHAGTVRRFAVNAVTDGESDLAVPGDATPAAIDRTLGRASVTQIDLEPLLLLLAVALLMLEWGARFRGRRAA